MISILMAAAISGIVSGAPAPSDTLASTPMDRTSNAQQLDDSKGGKPAKARMPARDKAAARQRSTPARAKMRARAKVAARAEPHVHDQRRGSSRKRGCLVAFLCST